MNNKIDSMNPENLNDDEEFLDIQTGTIMSRSEFVAKINNGKYPAYYVTPSINSDKSNDEKTEDIK